MTIGWGFPSNNSGSIDGLNNSGIQHFAEAPIVSMTRETIQDSLDASIKEPVLVKFELFDLAQHELPKHEELLNIFKLAEQTWSTSPETKKFFNDGTAVLRKPTIPVLAIRDYHTTGLENIDEKMNGSFAALVKSVGVTFKGASASGSFGIGKHAPFAASSIHTMFYGTYNRAEERALQGVAKLASYDLGDGNYTQGTGYYGIKEGYKPVRDLSEFTQHFQREEVGTDKYIIGFKGNEDWADDVIETVLLSYLVAIMDNKLEVEIGDWTINKSKIHEVVEYIMVQRPKSKVEQYYEAYTNPDRITKTKQFLTFDGELENITVSLLVREKFKRRISIYRGTGMKIYDKDRFRSHIDFAGVMVVEGPRLNAALRKMEPPTHDRWTASLYDGDIKYAKDLLKEINGWLNDEIRDLTKSQETETIELRGLEAILPDVSKVESPIKEVNEMALNEVVQSFDMKKIDAKQKIINPKKKKKKKVDKKPKGNGKGTEIDPQDNQDSPKPTNPQRPPKTKKSELSNARAFCITEERGLYRFIVVAKTSGDLLFNVHISGEDGSKSPIAIQNVKNTKTTENVPFDENKIGPIAVEGKEKIVLEVQFEENERYSLEVSV